MTGGLTPWVSQAQPTLRLGGWERIAQSLDPCYPSGRCLIGMVLVPVASNVHPAA